MKEPPRRSEGLDDAAVVGGVSDIAARAAGHENLDAGFPVFLEQQGSSAALRRANGRQNPRRPRPDHHHIPTTLQHDESFAITPVSEFSDDSSNGISGRPNANGLGCEIHWLPQRRLPRGFLWLGQCPGPSYLGWGHCLSERPKRRD